MYATMKNSLYRQPLIPHARAMHMEHCLLPGKQSNASIQQLRRP